MFGYFYGGNSQALFYNHKTNEVYWDGKVEYPVTNRIPEGIAWSKYNSGFLLTGGRDMWHTAPIDIVVFYDLKDFSSH
jgi:hypothetical protein